MKSNLKRVCIVFCLLAVTGVFTLPAAEAVEKLDPQLWEKALKIHQEAIVVDTHVDTPMVMMYRDLDMGQRNDKSEVDFIRMKEGGLDAVFFAAFVSNRSDDKHPAKNALELIDEIYRQVENHPDLAQLAFSPQDIRNIHQQGKRAILIGMENGGPVEDSLRLLRSYYRLGVRYITLTHGGNNNICDSSTAGEPKWNGLSPFGKEVVAEMNRLGMLIDVSHISDQAFWDVIKESRAPVMASHSCVRAICDVPRNLTDDMIRALVKNRGVIQVNFYSSFLDEDYKKKSQETRKKLEPETKKLREMYKDDRRSYWNEVIKLWKKHGPQPPKIDKLIDHIDYVVKLAGADYVGLGSDFDGAGSFPRGLEDVSGYPLITYHLLKRGYAEEDIKKILGGNFLRVFEEAIRTAHRISNSE
jgi:membrane dipeptidase